MMIYLSQQLLNELTKLYGAINSIGGGAGKSLLDGLNDCFLTG
jgi:hypothetical protein